MGAWRIVARGRLTREEVASTAEGSYHFVSVMRGATLGLWFGLLPLVLILIKVRQGEPAPFPLQMAFAFSLLGLPLQILMPMVVRRSAARSTPGEKLFDIDDAAIKITVDGGTFVVMWDALESFDARANGFYLYAADRTFLFIPRRFLSDEDLGTLRDFLSSRLKTARAERVVLASHLRLLAWVAAIGLALLAYQLLR